MGFGGNIMIQIYCKLKLVQMCIRPKIDIQHDERS